MIFYIDFDDSFSYNIKSYLSQIVRDESSLQSIHYSKFNDFFFSSESLDLFEKKYKIEKSKYIICLGPGPGHVNEYIEAVKNIKLFYKKSNCLLVGICMGHQLLLNILKDQNILRCKAPLHGRYLSLKTNKLFDTASVQRYNSWTVEADGLRDDHCVFDEVGELAAYREENLYTLQFHPESVGTSCPNLFFDPLKQFLG